MAISKNCFAGDLRNFTSRDALQYVFTMTFLLIEYSWFTRLKKKWKDWNKNANHPDVKIRHCFGLQ